MSEQPAAVRRLVYLGTPAEAVPPLQALVHAGFEVVLAVTRPDKPRGRRQHSTPSPVAAAAAELGIPVVHQVEEALQAQAQLGVVVAFGHIIPTPVLEQLPMVNVHFSLLPRWRGAAPVERAILAGDEVTGVCLMQVVPELDAGAVYRRVEVPIDPQDTAAELRNALVAAAVPLLVDALRQGLGPPEPQSGEPSYAHKLTPDDLHLQWNSPAQLLHRQVRVGGAWTTLDGRRLIVRSARLLSAADIELPHASLAPGELGPPRRDGSLPVGTAHGTLALLEVQAESRARQTAADWHNGARLAPHARLGI